MLDLRNISNLLRNISCLCMFLLFAPQFERDLYFKRPVIDSSILFILLNPWWSLCDQTKPVVW